MLCNDVGVPFAEVRGILIETSGLGVGGGGLEVPVHLRQFRRRFALSVLSRDQGQLSDPSSNRQWH